MSRDLCASGTGREKRGGVSVGSGIPFISISRGVGISVGHFNLTSQKMFEPRHSRGVFIYILLGSIKQLLSGEQLFLQATTGRSVGRQSWTKEVGILSSGQHVALLIKTQWS